jgi:DNA-binding beta-propeller fold protein YncE
VVYSASDDGSLYALDAATGQERWTFAPGDVAPVLAAGVLYFPSNDRNFYAVDAETGTEIWRFAMDGSPDQGPAVAAGVVYQGTDLGILYAIGGSEEATTTSISTSAATPQAGVPGATFVREFTGGTEPMAGVSGVALDASGKLYVVDPLNDQIRVFSPDGTPVAAWGESGTGPGQLLFHTPDGSFHGDLAFAPDGSLYVGLPFEGRIEHFTPDGTYLDGWGGQESDDPVLSDDMAGIAVDPAGRVYAADSGNSQVQVFQPDGTLIATWDGSAGIGAQLAIPDDVAIAPDGSVYVSDEDNHRVVHFAENGEVIGTVGRFGTGPGQLIQPWGVDVDAAGNLYVVDQTTNRIEVFAPDGTFLTEWGEEGSAPGQFSNPIYLAVSESGEVFVADEGNSRIQVFLPALGASGAAATPEAVVPARWVSQL